MITQSSMMRMISFRTKTLERRRIARFGF